MARREARTRGRLGRPDVRETRTANREGMVGGRAEVSVVPHVLLDALNGVEFVAVGAAQLTWDLLRSAVSGVASIGAGALSAAVAGARGAVSAASRMVGDIVGAGEGPRPRRRVRPRRTGRHTGSRLAA